MKSGFSFLIVLFIYEFSFAGLRDLGSAGRADFQIIFALISCFSCFLYLEADLERGMLVSWGSCFYLIYFSFSTYLFVRNKNFSFLCLLY